MYATLVRIYSVQYIVMWCLALMENQWRDKPTTAETIQKQFPNWHMEGLCDWFWLLLDFNTVHCELIDSQTSSRGLSTNCQMSPCLLFLLSHFFPPFSIFLRPFSSAHCRESGSVKLDWTKMQRTIHKHILFVIDSEINTVCSPLQSNPHHWSTNSSCSISWTTAVLTSSSHWSSHSGIGGNHKYNDIILAMPIVLTAY